MEGAGAEVSDALAFAVDQVAALSVDLRIQDDSGSLTRAPRTLTSDYEHNHGLDEEAETKQDACLLSREEDAADQDKGPEATGIAEKRPTRTYSAAQADGEEQDKRLASTEEQRRSLALLELDFSVDSMILSEDKDLHAKEEPEAAGLGDRRCTVHVAKRQDNGVSHSDRDEAEVHDDANASSLSGLVYPSPDTRVYSMATLFPRVFEHAVDHKVTSDSVDLKPRVTSDAEPIAPSSGAIISQSSIAGKVRPIKPQAKSSVEATRPQVRDQTRTHQLQLSLVESDRKNLSQRNARLMQQLRSLTADLQRSKAELSKLRTENELYASKLPQLQAELLEESAQVDEKDAQSLQSQLQITQWKARVQVFQTRHNNVERLNLKLQASLRNCKTELQRKTTANQQQTDKVKMLERDLSLAKTAHAQELLMLKQKLANALQKGEHDRLTGERAVKQSMELQVRTAKAKSAKVMKKCDELHALVESMGEKHKQLKRECDAAQTELSSQVKQVRILETLLQKAHRSEASLRCQSASLKAKARAADEQLKQRIVGFAGTSQWRKRKTNQIPIELLMLTDGEDDDQYDWTSAETRDHRKCGTKKTLGASDQKQQRDEADSIKQLSLQLRKAKDEIHRLRDLHAQELRAQSTAYTQLLKRVIPTPTLASASNLSGSA